MPTYELALLCRILPKPDLTVLLKRSAKTIFNTGGVIRKIENLGTRAMPYKTSCHGKVHKEASYFVYTFDAPPTKLNQIQDEYRRDMDIIRISIFKVEKDVPFQCTIDEEMKPPPYRKEVVELIEQARRKRRTREYNHNTGLNYYPFQK